MTYFISNDLLRVSAIQIHSIRESSGFDPWTQTFLLSSQEDANRGKPNWEHLADDLHVLITVEDTENRAKVKLQRAVEEVQKLLVPVSIN